MSQEKQENPAPQTDSPSAPAPDKPAKNNKPVVIYIMILFIAAFLLMALSFFMHQRSNTEALGELQSSVNAMQEIQISQEQIIELQEAVDDLEERNAALETELEETADLLDEARNQLQALQSLEELERLAAGNGEERQEAADRMKQYEAGTLDLGGTGLRPWLEDISQEGDPHSPAARYDTLLTELGLEASEGAA